MLNVPENLSGAVNRQTVLTINTKKVMEPLSSHSIGSINNMSCRNSPHTRSAPVTASSSVRATASSADSSSVRTTAQSAARTVPILKNPARKGQKFLSKPMPGLQESGHIWDGTSLILNVMWMYPLFF